jgi:uncharacterized damage-inducible protein DinB
MELSQFLRRGFDYDLWANRQWIRALGGFQDMARAQRVVEHILGTQRWWLAACGVEIVQAQVDIGLEVLFAETTNAWKALVEAEDLDTEILVPLRRGDATFTLAQMAMHVVNHGTYHRGQLRGLAQAEGYEGYPETDLILFLLE